ncbi:hypothetical protein BLA9940_00362 [Burkholderia aenigmatica]|uniref:Lipoprotein n=1 Tax=Burkholderia aenigmatica TaxID=2015348 RepID=A0ABY6XMN8_9BURK|nr:MULTISPECIES: hypothetical protein [Burkholderia]AYQ42169.1 hypothetical protein CVS37_30380 [Burkholderia lata]MCA8295465.1 hypothetical protein [Burkholderia sp. AU30198]VWC36105.1 hypothetical protein BLA9940_00362 [Burkholderia aenigmatica]VWC57407.1 hypothetical protein BLA17378_01775 [Burkholderia aenigmatica]VWC82093.1 hypothetical protein BLA18628_01280 [Burkholderia aenigmatica]
MSKPILTRLAVALIAFSGVAASACAQQQPAPPVVRQASQPAAPAYTAQLAARSSDDKGTQATAATRAVVPLRVAPASHPAAPDADCVGPVSFCNVYFGS